MIYSLLCLNILNHNERRILYKRFNQWRQRPKVDIHGEMAKIISFEKVIKKVIKSNLYEEKKTFLDSLAKTRADRALKKAGGKIFKNYNRKGINELRYYFNKWRKQINKDHITTLNKQVLKNVFINKEKIGRAHV